MKKSGLLARLEQVRVRSEGGCDDEMKKINQLETLALLVEYINDPQIKEAAEKIPF